MEQTGHVIRPDTFGAEWDPVKNFSAVEATGIGYGGLTGVTWNMAGKGERSVPIPKYVFDHLCEVMRAVAAYNKTLQHMAQEESVAALLGHKRPEKVKPVYSSGSMRLFRPDIVLYEGADGGLNFKITECESAPGGLGMFGAVNQAYDQKHDQTNILHSLREYIGQREFLIILAHGWIDYIWDVCVAAQWLRSKGVHVRVIIDRSREDVESFTDTLWRTRQEQMPAFTSGQPNWNPHLIQRLRKYGFLEFVEWHADLPSQVSEGSVVFRMGYHGSFRDRDTISRLKGWERKCNATILNGLNPGFENKAFMAALHLPQVRSALKPSIGRDVLQLLDKHFANTHLVDPAFCNLNQLCNSRRGHILKVAAWDPDDQLCWGARGLTDGEDCTNTEWVQAVGHALSQPYPVVVQERVESIRRNYRKTIDRRGETRNLTRARQRWTPMVLVDDDGSVHVDPGVITALDSFAAHGAVGAVMIPVKLVD